MTKIAVFFLLFSSLAKADVVSLPRSEYMNSTGRIVASPNIDRKLSSAPGLPFGDAFVTNDDEFHYIQQGDKFINIRCDGADFGTTKLYDKWSKGSSGLSYYDPTNKILVFLGNNPVGNRAFFKIDLTRKACVKLYDNINADGWIKMTFQQGQNLYLLTSPGVDPPTFKMTKFDFKRNKTEKVFECSESNSKDFCQALDRSIGLGGYSLGTLKNGAVFYYSDRGLFELNLAASSLSVKTIFDVVAVSGDVMAKVYDVSGDLVNDPSSKVAFVWATGCKPDNTKHCLSLGHADLNSNEVDPYSYSNPETTNLVISGNGQHSLATGAVVDDDGPYYNSVILDPDTNSIRLPRMVADPGDRGYPDALGMLSRDFDLISYTSTLWGDHPCLNAWTKIDGVSPRSLTVECAQHRVGYSELGATIYPYASNYNGDTTYGKANLFESVQDKKTIFQLNGSAQLVLIWDTLNRYLYFDRATHSLISASY